MFGGLGTTEILIILGILILLFGANQIPKLARSIGESRRELRRAMHEAEDDDAETKNTGIVAPFK